MKNSRKPMSIKSDDQYCSKCGQSWMVHNDDGSCIDDEALEKENKMRNQYDILLDIQAKGHNVVTCGDCGHVLLHDTGQEELTCPYCGFEDDISSFPDLFYKNWDK